MGTPKHNATVKLIGTNGNVFSVIGTVAKALRREVGPDAAKEFSDAAFACHSYEEVLAVVMQTVDVE